MYMDTGIQTLVPNDVNGPSELDIESHCMPAIKCRVLTFLIPAARQPTSFRDHMMIYLSAFVNPQLVGIRQSCSGTGASRSLGHVDATLAVPSIHQSGHQKIVPHTRGGILVRSPEEGG